MARPLFFGTGIEGRAIYVRPGTFDIGSATAPAAIPADRLVAGPILTAGPELHVGAFFARNAYVGAAWSFAAGRARDNGHSEYSASEGVNVVISRIGPFAGVRGRVGNFDPRIELRGLLDAMHLRFEQTVAGQRRERSTGTLRFGLEARAGIAWWAAPNLTLAAWVGADVLRLPDGTAGLALTWYYQSFAGSY